MNYSIESDRADGYTPDAFRGGPALLTLRLRPAPLETTMRTLRSFGLALALAGVATLSSAQFSQYTKAGNFENSPASIKDDLDEAVENAKWDFGRVRVDPWLALREVTYDDNIGARAGEQTQSDLTATLGAGFRAYLPFGKDLVFATHVLPEYVWWRELSNRRRVNGRVGLGLFGNLGRTSLEASVTRADEARFFSREFEDQVNTTDEVGFLSLALDLSRGFSVFANGRLRRLSFRDEDAAIEQVKILDREETIQRAGVSHTSARGLTIGVGVEDSEVEFEAVDNLRSNSGTSPLVQLQYVGPDFFFVIEAVDRDLEFPLAPELLDYDDVTGQARFEIESFERLGLQAYGRRGLVYSFTDRWAYFEETTIGAAVRWDAATWLAMRVFSETGNSDFRPVAAGIELREEDFDGYGIEFQFAVRRATLLLSYSKTSYDANLQEFDRDVTVIRTGLLFGSRTVSPWG